MKEAAFELCFSRFFISCYSEILRKTMNSKTKSFEDEKNCVNFFLTHFKFSSLKKTREQKFKASHIFQTKVLETKALKIIQ